ncbi:hypothetical protein D3C72_1901660 [compost metagenome]
MNYGFSRFIVIILINPAIIVPRTDTGTGLPGLRFNGVALSTFNIPYQAFSLLFIQDFSIDYHINLAFICLHAFIIKIGCDLQANIAYWIKWQHRIVKINDIGFVIVDQFQGPGLKVFAIGLCWHTYP